MGHETHSGTVLVLTHLYNSKPFGAFSYPENTNNSVTGIGGAFYCRGDAEVRNFTVEGKVC